MKRAVITGLGIKFPVSVITAGALASLREGRSDHFPQEPATRACVATSGATCKLDTTGLIDRKVVRFMSDASIYAFLL